MLSSEHRRSRGETSPGIYGLAIPQTEDLPGSGSYLQRGGASSSGSGGGGLRSSHGDVHAQYGQLGLGKTTTSDFRQRASSEAVALGDAFKGLNMGGGALGNGTAAGPAAARPGSRSVSTSHANGNGVAYRSSYGGH